MDILIAIQGLPRLRREARWADYVPIQRFLCQRGC
jgi:hypothetical protein